MNQDQTQNERLSKIEDRVNTIENDLSAILAKLEVSQSLLKVVLAVAGAALGMDVVPINQRSTENGKQNMEHTKGVKRHDENWNCNSVSSSFSMVV